MKAIRLLGALVAVAILTASCATYQIRRDSVEAMPALANQLSGKVLAIEPTVVTFGASRFAIDLRDVHLSVNGSEVQLERRYLAKEQDNMLGPIGVLDVDILTKAHTDPARVGAYAQEVLVGGFAGNRDWKVGFI